MSAGTVSSIFLCSEIDLCLVCVLQLLHGSEETCLYDTFCLQVANLFVYWENYPCWKKKKQKKNRCIFPSSDSFILSHKVIQFIVFFLFFFLLRMQTYSLSLYTTGMYCCSSNAFNFCPGLFLSKADLSPLEWYHPFTTVLKRYCSDYTFFSFIFNSLLMICLLYTKLFTCSFKRKS